MELRTHGDSPTIFAIRCVDDSGKSANCWGPLSMRQHETPPQEEGKTGRREMAQGCTAEPPGLHV